MTLTLFEILTDEELALLKALNIARNVKIKDLTMEEVSDLRKVFWPNDQEHQKVLNFMDVIVQLSRRKAL